MGPSDPLRRHAEQIEKAAERGAELTRQLLAYSRKQVLNLQVVDLGAVVAGTESMLRRLIGENIELVTFRETPLGAVTADVGQLEQVIVNLVVNARDAVPQGGRITITLRNAVLDEGFVREHPGARPGPSRAARGGGQRRRHDHRDPEPLVRAVLHDQGDRAGARVSAWRPSTAS